MTVLSPAFLDAALEVAIEAAAAAESVVARHYRARFEVEIKADASPVTIADREAEQAILAVLRAAYPDHAVYGEEYGRSGEGEFLWLVDPIDGTKAFVRGYPVFSTQIALMHRGDLVLGVSSAGQFGERACARLGGGAFVNGERVQVGPAACLADGQLSLGNLKTLAADARRWAALAGLVRGANRTRGYGDFLHYHYLARGAVDAVIESDVNILDIAALAVIVREAGAVFTELDGGPLTLDTRTVLAAVPALHDELRLRLA
ncbi:MAG: inositol-phosphate phosphatase [Xanthomonadales bacterium]|nr:inositol-phosphate phosphatase [Xanthomonadales bacterium]MBK7144645.1 inositol-phosphate phosphatase [Xanthomonadales bacterium]MCC6560866.1 inositol-phosphate phosphatase [Xanthomonadales bacterium]